MHGDVSRDLQNTIHYCYDILNVDMIPIKIIQNFLIIYTYDFQYKNL